MSKIDGVGFVGLKTERFDDMVTLFRDVIGAEGVPANDAHAASFRLNDGTLFEIYGPENEFHAFFKTGPVVGFRVQNFDLTRAAMIKHGIKFIGDPQHDNGISWQHFHCPDGTIAEIIGPGKPKA